MAKRKNILSQMFDVRPLKADGSLDMEKIGNSERILRVTEKSRPPKKIFYAKMNDVRKSKDTLFGNFSHPKKPKDRKMTDARSKEKKVSRRPNAIHLGKIMPTGFISISKIPTYHIFSDTKREDSERFQEPVPGDFEDIFGWEENIGTPDFKPMERSAETEKEISDSTDFALKNLAGGERKRWKEKKFSIKRKFPFEEIFSAAFSGRGKFSQSFAFVSALLIFSMILPCFAFVQRGFDTKNILLDSGNSVLGEFAEARDNLTTGQFEKASLNFEQSQETLRKASDEVSKIGGDFSEVLRFIPGVSKVATANYILKAGENISEAGKIMTDSMQSLAGMENPLEKDSDISLTELFLDLRDGISDSGQSLERANENLSKANIDDLPPEIQPKFLELKEKLPLVVSSLQSFSNDSNIILDILGYNGPRKFLFLFQNNQEMRATGGFIGSYGILDISNGRIKKLFVDDIYNPDGQLTARVIPPEPIQKMSAVWTMHDANWFPDFPASAEKISWFYEKTGGPTVDGVVSMTPTVIQKMLSVTGPIEMPDYDTTVDENNFIEKTQQEVEVDYDKEENQPKKFIADLTPKVLDKLLSTKNPKDMFETLRILNAALKEKQILIYSKNYNIQKMVSAQGWSGEILNTGKDFLSVVNTNINGYKTDGVIEETISHRSEIQNDGSIIDTVSVTRKHNGGNEKYEWWNKVNGDWMRIYVPEKSKLLEASGQTHEFVAPPLDYSTLGFKKDPQVEAADGSARIDENTGTRIYDENNKTVFANWVYVSPGESATINYKYVLPFKLKFDSLHHPADNFSVLYQKQSGSVGSRLTSEIKLPENMRSIWHWPEKIDQKENSFIMETSLDTDKFIGLAMEK